MKIAICPGHYDQRKGVIVTHIIKGKTHRFVEHLEAYTVAEFLKQMLEKDFDTQIIIGRIVQKARIINEWGADIAVDIHFNASTISTVQGCETLHSGSEHSIYLAEQVQAAMSQHFNRRRSRGVKLGYYEVDANKSLNYFLEYNNCPAIITEGLFLSNPEEAAALLHRENHAFYAGAIAIGIRKYFEAKSQGWIA